MSYAWGRLVVLEREDAYVVASEADPDDWLCRFERRGGFLAQRWAENMVATYNRRLESRSVEYPGGADRLPSK